MSKVFITVVGTQYRYGQEFIKEGMELTLVKEPDNDYDNEAIRAELEGLGLIGYVANSTRTVIGESYSAGRLYDKIGKKGKAVVKYVLPNGLFCEAKIDSDN